MWCDKDDITTLSGFWASIDGRVLAGCAEDDEDAAESFRNKVAPCTSLHWFPISPMDGKPFYAHHSRKKEEWHLPHRLHIFHSTFKHVQLARQWRIPTWKLYDFLLQYFLPSDLAGTPVAEWWSIFRRGTQKRQFCRLNLDLDYLISGLLAAVPAEFSIPDSLWFMYFAVTITTKLFAYGFAYAQPGFRLHWPNTGEHLN